MGQIRIRRIYDDLRRGDARESPGEYRTLVDRLWPRGVSRAAAALDEWLPEIAPSPWLRRMFGHDPRRFGTFRGRYIRQLRSRRRSRELERLRRLSRERDVVLLYGARDEIHNQAVVIREVLGRDATG